MSMRIERSSLDSVKKRFEMNKKKMEEKKKEYDFEERIKELKEEVIFITNTHTHSVTHTCTPNVGCLRCIDIQCYILFFRNLVNLS